MQDILHAYILNLNENENFVAGLRTVTVPYFSSDKSNVRVIAGLFFTGGKVGALNILFKFFVGIKNGNILIITY